MSIINTVICSILKRGKKDFDTHNPPNYPAIRAGELHYNALFRKPRDISITEYRTAAVSVEMVKRLKNPEGKVILHFHGGGFVTGSAEAQKVFNCFLAKHVGLNVITPNYALAPERPYPQGVSECYAVYCELVKQYGAENIFVLGGSAGGNLALSVMLRAKAEGTALAAGLAVFSPTLQYTERFDSYISNQSSDCMIGNLTEEVRAMYFQSEDESIIAHPYASPLNGDFTGFPPVFITVSESEILRDDSLKLCEKLRRQKVKTVMKRRPGMIHAYTTISVLPEAKKDIIELRTFVRQCMRDTSENESN